VLGRCWAGQPFSHQGRDFEARDVVALPAPPQQPIPIWLGGNSRLTLQRVATRAQGWLPLLGPPQLATTTRTAHVGSLDDLERRLALLQDLAGDRFGSLDIAVPLAVPLRPPADADLERQRDTLGRMAALGATAVIVSTAAEPHPAVEEFLEAFAAAHIR
jgi:alkanesulfonate monooxygenase SsuD/methylene tetrahydromethanopterin reductase-like flavin-dependent oxidoreductase (luciferase family)